MSSTEYTHNDGDDYITERIDTGNQIAEVYGHIPHRHLRVTLLEGQLTNDGSDIETITVHVVDGLALARGGDPDDATVLDYNGGTTVEIDGSPQTAQLSDGSVEIEITTERPAGSEISVRAVGLADHPADSDSATIEVTT